jgi:hypothetical protein
MLVAESACAHVRQLDRAFGARIHEPVAAQGVEFGGSNNFGEFLHVRRLNIDDVEALVLDVQVPEVYAQIVAAYEGFTVAIYRDTIDVVGMSIGIGTAGDGGYNCVVVRKAWESELVWVSELKMA